MKKELIKNELSELKKFTNMTNKIYADKFLKKSLLLKMKTTKIVKNNSLHNSTNVYTDISITNIISKKSKQYRLLMFKLKNNENLNIKKFDYALLNELLNVTLYENEIALIIFLFKHIKRIRKTPNKDYSLHYFIILFVIMMVLAFVFSIYLAKQKNVYFHRV